MNFICQNSFILSRELNDELLWKDKIHKIKKGSQQVAFTLINVVRYRKV